MAAVPSCEALYHHCLLSSLAIASMADGSLAASAVSLACAPLEAEKILVDACM